jgi:hypothetical protein
MKTPLPFVWNELLKSTRVSVRWYHVLGSILVTIVMLLRRPDKGVDLSSVIPLLDKIGHDGWVLRE